MMKRTNNEASTLLVLLSILSIIFQFAAYRFFHMNIVIWGIACLISVICCHVQLSRTNSYSNCFDYSFLTLFISLVIIVLTYLGRDSYYLPYTSTMLGIAFINWLIPLLYCLIRNMFEYGDTIEGFRSFYRNSSIIFLIFYIAILFYANFSTDSFRWAYINITDKATFIPFTIITAQIKDFLDGSLSLMEIVGYLSSRILIFVPYGFFIFLVMRRVNPFIRCLILLILPYLIELIQYFTFEERCTVDDLIYAFVGGLLGFFTFFLINTIYRAVSGRDFLFNETAYGKYRNALHF